MNIIEIENLNFAYARQALVLKDLSLQVQTGSFLALAGPNGAGKTTLLNLICGLLKPQSGSITIAAKPIKAYTHKDLARQVAVVSQQFVPVFGFSVIETVMMARALHFDALGFESKSDRQKADEALEVTDTASFAARLLGRLSGGERQRVFIARALAQETPILLLDEPTSFLDLKHQVAIYDLLKKMQLEKGKTIVAATHDINLAAQYCDRILLLGGDGGYQVTAASEIFSDRRIENVFGVSGFAGTVGRQKFFLPLGKFAKDAQAIDRRRRCESNPADRAGGSPKP